MHCQWCTTEASLAAVHDREQEQLKQEQLKQGRVKSEQHEAKIQRACSVLMPKLGTSMANLSAKRYGDTWQFSWNLATLDVKEKGGARHTPGACLLIIIC
jgi:hypothetical protein